MDNMKNNVKSFVLGLLAIGVLLVMFSGCEKQPEKPIPKVDSHSDLVNSTGAYARKSFWEHLPETKIWSEALSKYNQYDATAVDLFDNGLVAITMGWHEADTAKVFEFRPDGLWIKGVSSEWTGPFIRIGNSGQDNVLYFNRIFGSNCYTSDKNERWCFHSGAIQIDNKKHKAELKLDLNETPDYGTPVFIDNEENSLLMFVPIINGWKVFQDSVLGDDRIEIDPDKTAPWRTLKKLPNQ